MDAIRLSTIMFCAATVSATACTRDPGDGDSSASISTNPGDTGDTSNPDTGVGDTDDVGGMQGLPVEIRQEVDVLFVIDNSGSMAEEQAQLAQNFAAFLNVLEGAGASYRLGVTTTDAGNPRCPTTTPENGTLVLSSCLDRAASGEFRYNNEDFSFACEDHCDKTDADLKVRPTTTELEAVAAPRKWIEGGAGASNIEGVASNVEAFQCYGPQGIAGCGFEAPLESMFRALTKAGDPASAANYGFLRAAAALAIVVLTDETDCSYNPDAKDIFVNNRVFWNDPNDVQPTSALCWRAGVACTSAGGASYSECHAENYDLSGARGAADADAVLKPVGGYIKFVKGIEAAKGGQGVVVGMINGVPVGYEAGAPLVYADSPDPDYQDSFGVAPGCVLGDPDFPEVSAVPPVREREFAEAFAGDARNLYSICQPDYSGALTAIAGRIRDQLRPGCVPGCVLDLDRGTPRADASCRVFETDGDGERTELKPCVASGDAWTVPGGATACWAALTDFDGAQTPAKLDDMSPRCADQGLNLEVEVVRTGAAPAGATLAAVCEMSDDKRLDCPLL